MSLIDRDARAIAAIEKLRFFDLAVIGGHGSRLRLEDGREVLDLSASWGAASLGNAHPDVAVAAGRALADMAGASILSVVNGPAVELAERLLATFRPASSGACGSGTRAPTRTTPPCGS